MFKEDFKYTAQDIRFTTKGNTLYAIALGWPEGGRMTVKSLAATGDPAVNKIERVELLGADGALKFTQDAGGLTVDLPAVKVSEYTCALRITGTNLKPVAAQP